jgi:hypothetical protein
VSWSTTLCLNPFCMLYWRGLLTRLASTPAVWLSSILLAACLALRAVAWKAAVRQLGLTTEAYHIAQEAGLLSAGQCNKVVRAGQGEAVFYGDGDSSSVGGDGKSVELVAKSASAAGAAEAASAADRDSELVLVTPRTADEMLAAEKAHRAEHEQRMAANAGVAAPDFRRTKMI